MESIVPFISVIVPVFNSEKTLNRCIDSIINQSFNNWEILIIDNNSSDKSREISDLYVMSCENIYFFSCGSQGVSYARNMGIENAKGKYIFFLDSDDYIMSDLFLKFYEFTQNDVDLITLVPHHTYIDDNQNIIKTDVFSDSFEFLKNNKEIVNSFAKHLNDYSYYFPSKLYKTSLIKENNIFFDTTLSLGEDILFNIRVLKKCSVSVFMSQPSYNYTRNNKESLNNKYRKNLLTLKDFINSEIEKFLLDNAIYDQGINELRKNIVNDLFMCIRNAYIKTNATKKEVISEIESIASSELSKKIKLNIPNDLPFVKRLFAFLLTRNFCHIIYYAIKFSNSGDL